MNHAVLPLVAFATAAFAAAPLQPEVTTRVDAEMASLEKLYRELHAAPELSFHEVKTAARMAAEVRALGWEVTEKIGGHGVVAVLKNGPGPTILVRADMDALPVPERTGLPFASKVRVKDESGVEVPVMHACGHDVHMTCWVGTARVLTKLRDRWKGTLVFIAQPAEEKGGGSEPMLRGGLFTRFPKPNFCLALHVNSELPAGVLGYREGPQSANVDSVDITVHGVGGHGAQPHTAKDPIVLAAQLVLALQTIDSREIHPLEPVVVTVGSIHGGTKHNIIPESVKLQLTIRSFSDEVRQRTLDAIKRISRGLGIAAGLPEGLMPAIKEAELFTPVLTNEPVLTRRVTGVFREWFGADNVRERPPTMGGEDFSRYGRTEDKVPIFMFAVGSIDPRKIAEAKERGEPLPSLHSPYYAPVFEPTVKSGVTAMSAAVLELLGR
ncbi:MAG: amidohydrolase [Chthoniobacteraceae bacterium]